jgi:hypothetical protein
MGGVTPLEVRQYMGNQLTRRSPRRGPVAVRKDRAKESAPEAAVHTSSIVVSANRPSFIRSTSAPIPIPAGPRNVVGPTGHQSPWWVGASYSRPRIGVRSCIRPVSFGRAGGRLTYRANLPGPPRLPRLRNRRRFSRTPERLRYPPRVSGSGHIPGGLVRPTR